MKDWTDGVIWADNVITIYLDTEKDVEIARKQICALPQMVALLKKLDNEALDRTSINNEATDILHSIGEVE